MSKHFDADLLGLDGIPTPPRRKDYRFAVFVCMDIASWPDEDAAYWRALAAQFREILRRLDWVPKRATLR